MRLILLHLFLLAASASAQVRVMRAEPAGTPAPMSFSDAIAIPAAQNISYNARWLPPGENQAWVMDCSNTARWLYREVRGIDLPRTASDQYELLRRHGRLWRTRDERTLRKRLRPGDLLFWENTYKPPRKPPVTHVMVYLGTDARGRMMMAGSQNSSGPDIYEFHPDKKTGGYRFFFFFHRDGRFVAYGRP
jgi:cell wall-associated NlpC family hydrolase